MASEYSYRRAGPYWAVFKGTQQVRRVHSEVTAKRVIDQLKAAEPAPEPAPKPQPKPVEAAAVAPPKPKRRSRRKAAPADGPDQ